MKSTYKQPENINENAETTETKELTNRDLQFSRLLEVTAHAREIKEQLIQNAQSTEQAFYYEAMTINHIILNMIYKKKHPEINDFKKFREWKQEGATVRKGAKAFVIWGQPIGEQKRERAAARGEEYNPTPEEEQSENTRFPMCYIFADTQVITKEAKEAAKQEAAAARNNEEAATILETYHPTPVTIF